ncbi:MAG: PEGA domain-containing protein, partial [Gammaproteobacteria bacterium]
MSRKIVIVDSNGVRSISDENLPLNIGSQTTAQIRIPGSVTGGSGASIDLLEGRPFLHRGVGTEVTVNGEIITANRWLIAGDTIAMGGVHIACEFDDDVLRFVVTRPVLEYETLPPELVPPAAAAADAPEPITPVQMRAQPLRPAARGRTAARIKWVVYGALGGLFVVAVYLFTAQAVLIEVEPADTEIRIVGGLIAPKMGGRYLLRQGDYRIMLSAEGYHPAREVIVVDDSPNPSFRFVMRKLPGWLVVTTDPEVEGRLFIDDAEVGVLPGVGVEVEVGAHAMRIVTQRYLEFTAGVEIEGREVRQELHAELQPAWGDIAFVTDPPDAEIYVDEQVVGRTPATVSIMAGEHAVLVRKGGYKSWTHTLSVDAGRPEQLPLIALVEVDGLLSIVSMPTGAAVSVDGRYRGTTPAEVELAPGRRYEVIVSKPGFGTVTRSVEMESRRGHTVRLTLEPRLGIVRITTDQADAELFVDGESRGHANQELTLPARMHRIEVRKPGFATFTAEVNPQPGMPEEIDIRMLTPAEAVLAAIPQTLTTSDGTTLLLIGPGELEMGAPRREQGRRANEAQHRVRLTRPFYIATTEVTNSRFQAFKPKHTSGAEKYRQLATGNHPAVMMSWEEATGYCNWLSTQNNLPPAYVFENGEIVLVTPVNTGYRLPTEAEWAWAGRFSGGGGQLKYPWGDQMPLTDGAGNYADQSARGILTRVLSNYNDGFPITSPAGRFRASPL